MKNSRSEGLSDRHPVLFAAGSGSLIAFCILAAVLASWWMLLAGLLSFFGTAALAEAIDER